MKKIFAMMLAALLMVVSAPAIALADDARSVTVSPNEITLRVGLSRRVNARVNPGTAPDYVDWETTDRYVVEVDSNGLITAVGPGTAYVRATAHNGRSGRVFVTVVDAATLARIEREEAGVSISNPFVPGTVAQNNENFGNPFNPTAGDGASGSATSLAATNQEVSTAVNNALAAAPAGTVASAVIRGGKTSVESTALRAAHTAARNAGKPLRLQFTTPDHNGQLQGQLNLYAANAASAVTINPAVYTIDEEVSAVRTRFANLLGKPVAVIKCGQEGSYGMTVDVYGKVDLAGMDTSRLVFYTYNLSTNRATQIQNTSYSIVGDHLRISTNTGGYIIICN